jgi:hypothetical protein
MAATERQHAASQQQIGKGKQKNLKKLSLSFFFFFFFWARRFISFSFVSFSDPRETLSSEIFSFISNIEEQSNKIKKDNNQL